MSGTIATCCTACKGSLDPRLICELTSAGDMTFCGPHNLTNSITGEGIVSMIAVSALRLTGHSVIHQIKILVDKYAGRPRDATEKSSNGVPSEQQT